MELIEKVFDALSDGPHDINELSTVKGLRKLSVTKLMVMLDFLAEYDFIELRQAWKGDPLRSVVEAKLQPSFQEFLREIKGVEETEKGGKVNVGRMPHVRRRIPLFLSFPQRPHKHNLGGKVDGREYVFGQT